MAHEPNLTLDENLRRAILAYFAASEISAFTSLHVGVLNGIVHLAGSVPSLEARSAAAELAESVTGVRGVVNRIEAPGAPSPARTVSLSPRDEEETIE
jgi:osmotically-inducible protein OsmY